MLCLKICIPSVIEKRFSLSEYEVAAESSCSRATSYSLQLPTQTYLAQVKEAAPCSVESSIIGCSHYRSWASRWTAEHFVYGVTRYQGTTHQKTGRDGHSRYRGNFVRVAEMGASTGRFSSSHEGDFRSSRPRIVQVFRSDSQPERTRQCPAKRRQGSGSVCVCDRSFQPQESELLSRTSIGNS
jgi:hypothetical protein